MYIHASSKSRSGKDRSRSARRTAKKKAKQRRRVNGMAGRRLSARGSVKIKR